MLFRSNDTATTEIYTLSLHDALPISLVSRKEFYALQSEKFVEEAFDGSLPAFLAAFGSRKRLSQKEIDELQKLIDGMREENHG